MGPTKQRALVTILIGLGVIFIGIFGLRTAFAIREFRQHRPPHPHFETEQPVTDVELIRDWMTLPFIGRTYHVPPPIIFQALGIPKNKTNEEKSLKQLNEEFFPNTPGVVLKSVKAAVQANLPPATTVPPATAIPVASAVPVPSP
jgi:hypothetical protein